MMEYLKTLGISELINFLEIESDNSENFETVGELLSSREKTMKKQVEDLEKSVKLYKTKCSELANPLEEAKKKGIPAESNLEEFKMLSDKLKEKVSWLEGECKVISDREKKAVQNVGSVSAELEKIGRKRNEELMEFKRRLVSLNQKAESEIEEERKRYKKLEKLSELAIGKLGKDLEVYKAKCSDLGTELQEKKEKISKVEGNLEGFKKYKMMSNELEEKVTRLEKDCQIFTEREKKVLENVASLSADLERMSRKRNVELGECKRALECEKQKAENEKKSYTELENKSKDAVFKLEKDLEMQKWMCSELSRVLEEKEKKNIEVQSKLEEFKEYEILCGQLKAKVTCLEENCNIVSEREKAAIEFNTTMLDALEKVRRDSDAELNELKTKNKDLECAKLKAEDELTDQMARIEELEKVKENLIEDLEMCKGRCSDLLIRLEEDKQHSISMEVKLEEFEKYTIVCNELKEKVSCLEGDCKIASEREKSALDRITDLIGELEKISLAYSEELNELKEKNKDLECAKQKAEDEVKAQKERYKSPVPAKANCEVGAENKEGKIDKNKQGIIESETNEPLNAANSPKLKITLKDLSFECNGKVRDHVSSVSPCNFVAKASGGGLVPVSTLKRKLTSTSRKCDGGSVGQVGIDNATDHNKAMTPGPSEEKRRKVECSLLRPSVTKETSNKKSRGRRGHRALRGKGRQQLFRGGFQQGNRNQIVHQAEPLQTRVVPLPLPAPVIAANGGRQQRSQNFTCRTCGDPSHFARDCPWYRVQNTGQLVPNRNNRRQIRDRLSGSTMAAVEASNNRAGGLLQY